MGDKGGRPRKPTHLKLLHGDRADRINADEPEPAPVDIVPPDWLNDAGRFVWDDIAPDLIRTGVLTGWDVELFAALCDAIVRRRTATEALDEQGEVVEAPVYDKNGNLAGHRRTKNPWWQIWKEADDLVRRHASKFGLTPSDRAGLKVGGESDDPTADLLTG